MIELKELHQAARRQGRIDRRLFLAYGAALTSLPLMSGRTEALAGSSRSFQSNPFALGVASGDPSNSGMVLWTRLAPRPLEPGNGLPPTPMEVHWEIANDDGMREIVRRGKVYATPQLGHSVHVTVEGLKPDRWYWYRFRSGDADSPVGRTRTLPDANVMPEKLRFAFASCQKYEDGYFTAYEQMAKDDLDLVFFLGDYIYEGAGRNNRVRKHLGKEIKSLDEYRIRYSQYRADELLHGMHARCPWFVTWDDHELDNNCAADISEERHVDPVDFMVRRANAYQAYYEMMPLRARSLPRGPFLQLFRKASFGRLAEFYILDTRQYRTDQPNNDDRHAMTAAALDPKATILGSRQRHWLQSSLIRSGGTWNVLAQQVMMGMADTRPGSGLGFSADQWAGYVYERESIMRFMEERRVPNPIVLTGDIHTNWVNDLRVNDRKMDTPIVATEFVGTSISTGGNGSPRRRNHDAVLSENPFVRFLNSQRGYVLCTLTPKEWQSDYIIVKNVQTPGGSAKKTASFVVESGRPGAQPA